MVISIDAVYDLLTKILLNLLKFRKPVSPLFSFKILSIFKIKIIITVCVLATMVEVHWFYSMKEKHY